MGLDLQEQKESISDDAKGEIQDSGSGGELKQGLIIRRVELQVHFPCVGLPDRSCEQGQRLRLPEPAWRLHSSKRVQEFHQKQDQGGRVP